ncbi:trans-aconitate 2-methyltransferase [Planobispora rosea]|uniref:Trans-aconitate 2-methyltransferase n=1 Tax=Planobispora rosea TaxID=35762 RepID=A0A8J3S3C9_PLARO|nr:trans-aconitate 2-methyltransferase [Planobispora rosea]GGS90697.1 trans-aconitate 2-methyltransferase [Planobispora rosea]GIH87007.1 trans-aconitate 2-methyltransferase [Planobispora rosea]
MWDPEAYGRYADERSRPFFDLTGRITAKDPAYVVDAGCGTGDLTAELARRWPGAEVHGFDSSPAMIDKAPAGDRLSFSVGDVTDWRPGRPVDVIVSNAVLQWVPEHRDLLPRWVQDLAPGGWLAFQMPGNFDAPSHVILRDLCRTKWLEWLGDLVRNEPVGTPAEYLELLTGLGCAVDAWETTYLHVLPGENAVLHWVSGTALRPVIDRLPLAERNEFLADFAAELNEAYPRRPYGTVFPFRRIFVVARKSGAGRVEGGR